MPRWIIVVALLCTSRLFVCAEMPGTPKGWRIFEGDWFKVAYPPGFRPIPEYENSIGHVGVNSARFVSPDGAVEFYVFSPQWRGWPSALMIDDTREIVTYGREFATAKPGWVGDPNDPERLVNRWVGITAKDGSYLRFVHYRQVDITNMAFGIKVKNMRAYAKYYRQYHKFRLSLVQYADGNPSDE